MPGLRQYDKLACWYEKIMHVAATTIDIRKMRNLKTRKTPWLTKTIHLLIIIIEMEIEASQVKLWIGFLRKIFIQIGEANKVNPLLLP